MRPDDIGLYRTITDPQLHPDGARIAFVVSQMDLDADRYRSSLWLWVGQEATRLTEGPGDRSPRWSPDGTGLAFVHSGEDYQEGQLAIRSLDADEVTVLTDFAHGVKELAWSPDGSSIAVVAEVWAEGFGDDPDADDHDRVRRITELPYREDDEGWSHDRRRHIYLVDPTGGSDPVCLTPGDDSESDIAWNPAGDELAFLSARHDARGVDPGVQLWRQPVAGGDAMAATDVGTWEQPSYDAAGNLYVLGLPDRWAYPAVLPLQQVAADGSLTSPVAELDRDLVTDSPELQPGGPQWLADGGAISTVEDAGRVRLIQLRDGRAADGWSVTDIVGGDRAVTGFSARSDGSALAFTATTATDPGELWWWEDGRERCLTDFNARFRDTVPLVSPQRFVIEHESVAVDGWIYLPPGDDPVPALLNILGGPATQYGYQFFDEFQVYAAAGYGVVATNPRGSSGYGHDHVRAVVGRWFEDEPPDVRDLEAAVDAAAAAAPRLDTDRVGVMGGSYGGLMTVRLIGRSQHYRSAVAERGLYNFLSFHGTSDISPWFTRLYLGERFSGPMDREWLEKMWAASPLSVVEHISTPTLVIHSESDHRTPIEQGEQLFTALIANGATAELARFPVGASHELSRSGPPRLRRERFQLILEWHGRYL